MLACLCSAPAALASGTGGVAPAEPPPVAPGPQPVAPVLPPGPYAVGVSKLPLVDAGRRIRIGRRRLPRPVTTWLRYPAAGAGAGVEIPNAPAAGGSLPLIVFAHGFDVTPATYTRLLDAWAAAGYVVAAPVFLLSSSEAPGGADESDVLNQPADVSFVISTLLVASASPSSPLHGLIDPTRIAVAGQSDGGVVALLSAYGRRYRDPRIRAAVVLSGSEWSGIGGYAFTPGSAPLLAVQGTSDPINSPSNTYEYFRAARRPKYLLRLLRAKHLPPYTTQQPQLQIVESATRAFLGGYLQERGDLLSLLGPLATVPRVAALTSEP